MLPRRDVQLGGSWWLNSRNINSFRSVCCPFSSALRCFLQINQHQTTKIDSCTTFLSGKQTCTSTLTSSLWISKENVLKFSEFKDEVITCPLTSLTDFNFCNYQQGLYQVLQCLLGLKKLFGQPAIYNERWGPTCTHKLMTTFQEFWLFPLRNFCVLLLSLLIWSGRGSVLQTNPVTFFPEV